MFYVNIYIYIHIYITFFFFLPGGGKEVNQSELKKNRITLLFPLGSLGF